MKTSVKVIIIIAVLVSVTLAITLPIVLCKKSDDGDNDNKGTVNQYIMHRGGRHGNYYENTIEAFEYAITTDCYGIETDVWKTKDGHFVCTHDKEVSLTGFGYVDVTKENYETIKNYNLRDSGKPIVLLDDYLKICKKGNKVAVIEIKDVFDTTEAQSFLNKIDECYSRDKVCIVSFKKMSLDSCRELDGELDYYFCGLTTSIFYQAITEGYNVGLFVGGSVSDENLKAVHDAGLKLMFGTVNNKKEAEDLIKMGVDLVTTDTYF